MTQCEDQALLSGVVLKASLQGLLMLHKIDEECMLLRNLSDSKNSFFIKLVKENRFSETCLVYLLISTSYCQKSRLFRFP